MSQTITAAQQSIVKGASSAPEMYIPLFWNSAYPVTASAALRSAGNSFLQLLSTSPGSSGVSNINLHTLSSNWTSSQLFAFEASIQSGTSGTAASAELWDITSNTAVTGSAISTTNTGFSLIRSGQFTLTPGHVYGVTLFNTVSVSIIVVDASLIVFP